MYICIFDLHSVTRFIIDGYNILFSVLIILSRFYGLTVFSRHGATLGEPGEDVSNCRSVPVIRFGPLEATYAMYERCNDLISISIKLCRPFHFDDKEQFSKITSIASGTLPRENMTENIHDVRTVPEIERERERVSLLFLRCPVSYGLIASLVLSPAYQVHDEDEDDQAGQGRAHGDRYHVVRNLVPFANF